MQSIYMYGKLKLNEVLTTVWFQFLWSATIGILMTIKLQLKPHSILNFTLLHIAMIPRFTWELKEMHFFKDKNESTILVCLICLNGCKQYTTNYLTYIMIYVKISLLFRWLHLTSRLCHCYWTLKNNCQM